MSLKVDEEVKKNTKSNWYFEIVVLILILIGIIGYIFSSNLRELHYLLIIVLGFILITDIQMHTIVRANNIRIKHIEEMLEKRRKKK